MSQKTENSPSTGNVKKFKRHFPRHKRTKSVMPTAAEAVGHSIPGSNLKCHMSDHGVLTIYPQGPLAQKDFDELGRIVDPWIKTHKKIQGVVICVLQFPGWENFASFMKHLNFIESHYKKVNRVALAVDGVLPKLLSVISSYLVKTKVKHFAFKQEKEALQWATEQEFTNA